MRDFNRRIAFTDYAKTVAVHREARIGDKLCHLPGCSLDVVLREEGAGLYVCR